VKNSHMPEETPHERAKALLQIHNGLCFISDFSDLVLPFREMEKAGLVTITPCGEIIVGFEIRKI